MHFTFQPHSRGYFVLLGSKVFISEVIPMGCTFLEFQNDTDNVWQSTEHNFSGLNGKLIVNTEKIE